MPDPKSTPNPPQPTTPGNLIHRAPWDIASQQITVGAMRGAKAAEEAFPEMECQEIVIEWSEPADFDDKGNAYVNTAEPGATPVKTTFRFARNTDPSLK